MNEKEISWVIALTHGADFKNVPAAAAIKKIKKWIATITQNKGHMAIFSNAKGCS